MRLISDLAKLCAQTLGNALRGQIVDDKMLLEQFGREVLGGGAEACLPVNLSREWLSVLCAQSEVVNSSKDSHANEFLAAVLLILEAKQGSGDGALDISEDELADCADQYRVELIFEQAARENGATVMPATVETIFTDRDAIIVRRRRSIGTV